MGTSALALQAAGVGYSTVSAYNQAKTQQGVLDYEAAVAGNNAKVAGYQADVAQQVGANEEQNARLKTADLFGAQRADMAANGIDLGEGSATDIQATTKWMGERDVATIKNNTAQQVWALKNQQAGYLAEQQATRAARASINPLSTAAGTLLTGAGSFAANKAKMPKATA